MNAPKIENLTKIDKSDSFTKAVEVEKKRQLETVNKTFSIQRSQLDKINKVAIDLSIKAGRPINASESLRTIINNYEAQ